MTEPAGGGGVTAGGRRLVVGADGMIGGALEAGLRKRGVPTMATTRRPASAGRIHLDLAQASADAILPDRLEVAYLLAATTSLAACASEPDLARRVNVEGTLALAARLAARGVRIVFVSTNLVLDGRAPDAGTDAPLAPQTAYGAQKAEVEAALLARHASLASVLRITKVAEGLLPLLDGWAADIACGRQIRPFTDLVCAPLALDDLVEALARLGDAPHAGLHHFGGERDVSYADIARRLAARMGADTALVQPTSSVEAGVALPAIPAFTTLACGPTLKLLGLQAPSVDQALDSVIAKAVAHLGLSADAEHVGRPGKVG